MDSKQFNVLFLCTGNSARSILAEAMFNQLGAGRFHAYSAGSYPRGSVNPLSISCLEKAGFPVAGLRSKSWDEFAGPDAPPMHFVITVCDQAAGEVCPIWPGQPVSAHWGLEDPAAVEGSEEEKMKAFHKTMFEISNRLSVFLNLPIDKLDHMALQEQVRKIGQIKAADNAASSL